MASPALIPVYEPSEAIERHASRVRFYAAASRAENTIRGYRSDWRAFEDWCRANGFQSLPANGPTIAAYLSAAADSGLKSGTIQRRVSSIASAHEAAGFENPCSAAIVRLTLAGLRRTLGTRAQGKAPLLTNDLAVIVSKLPAGLKGLRDRAILLFGFAGAFRRSELVFLNIEDLEFTGDGVRVTIRRSKTDQDGAGQTIGISNGGSLCPVRALREWIHAAGIEFGPVFLRVRRHGALDTARLNAESVADVVRTRAEAAGLDPARYAGHSLRAGLVTQAAILEIPESKITAQTRHRSPAMVQRYIRDVNVFRGNVSARVGL